MEESARMAASISFAVLTTQKVAGHPRPRQQGFSRLLFLPQNFDELLERRSKFRAFAGSDDDVFALGPNGVVDEKLELELLFNRASPAPGL